MTNRHEIHQRLNIADLLMELLPGAKPSGKNKLVARCPWPERHRNRDAAPSFVAFLSDGKFQCQACGEKGSIFDLYGKVHGLDFKGAIADLAKRAGLETSTNHKRVTGAYVYHDSVGGILYWKERIEPGSKERSKEFIFFHGRGVEPGKAYCLPPLKRNAFFGRGDCEPVLYRLPEVLAAPDVIFTEGEMKADRLHDWELTATSLDSGSQSKMTPEMVEQLAGKNVVILPDNDHPGRKYAESIARSLINSAASVKIVELPGLPEKGDILDWVKVSGNDKAKLLELILTNSEWAPQFPKKTMSSNDGTKPMNDSKNPSELRSFPYLYINLEQLLNDPRQYNFERGLYPLYHSLVLQIARAPGARFPKIVRAVANLLDTNETTAEKLLDTALQYGLLVLDSEGNLTHPMVTMQYCKALEKCRVYAENGQKGGKVKMRKSKKKVITKQ